MLPDTEACFHLDLLPKSAVTFRKVPIEKTDTENKYSGNIYHWCTRSITRHLRRPQ